MTLTIILITIIAIMSTISFFVIKSLRSKNKSLQYKVDFAEKEIKSQYQNITNYKKIIVKLNNKKVESDIVKKNINSASGSALASIVNGL